MSDVHYQKAKWSLVHKHTHTYRYKKLDYYKFQFKGCFLC